MQPLQHLVPEDTAVVVLDTSPARNLAYGAEPPAWAATFGEMSQGGYSFSLADNAFAELLAQITSGAIKEDEASLMFRRLELFINPSLPVFPGKKDIFALIGSKGLPQDWNIEQVRTLSARSWSCLKAARSSIGEDSQSTELELQDERESWFAIFEKLGKSSDTDEPLNEYESKQLDMALTACDDEDPELSPRLSVRWDLQIRLLWRQYVRSKKLSEPYDPRSPKKVNDGIDFDLFHYLLLPAFVIATDSGFFGKLADIQSYQKAWFWKPEDLGQAWMNGDQPRATWPA
jgi:hypothetical protein